MDDDEKYRRYADIPIPTYDEAITDRPSTSNNRGPGEVSDDAERQGLLGGDQEQSGYMQPFVESARSSVDSDLRLPEVTGGGDDARRQVMEELDYLDPSTPDTSRRSPRLYHRARLRNKWWSQHLSNLSATFSAIRLPSFRSLYTPVPAETATDTTPPTRLTWLTRVSQNIHIPERFRLSAPTFARICGLFTLVGLVYLLFAMDVFPNRRRRGGAQYDPESVRAYVQDHIDAAAIEGYLQHITSFDHVAGTEGDLYLAKWMEERWGEEGVFDQVALLPYYVYLDYPVQGQRSVNVLTGPGQGGLYLNSLEEDTVVVGKQQTLAWHAHGRSGEVQGPLIYANTGRVEDFDWLRANGVQTNGSVALVVQSDDLAMQIETAEDAGCIGVLVYSNPGDVPAASAWQAPHDMLQRGSVSNARVVLGDPLTPGFASTQDARRLDDHSSARKSGLPVIPSLPLSWRDAQKLIESMDGHGVTLPVEWTSRTSTDNGMVDWWSGTDTDTDPGAPVVHLQNHNDINPTQQIWNLHGMIEGMETPEKKIIIGNNRDAFCFGAADPGSGSAVMMMLVSVFGQLRTMGWRPLRTIEFVSWDAGAYNSIGSTEYVEDNLDYLRMNGVAYLNVGAGITGPDEFWAQGSPMWQKSLLHVLDRVGDPRPNSTSTLRPLWQQKNGDLDSLESGDGDFAPFQYIAGTSSIDFGFRGDANGYPKGSCYDTFEWMMQFGDPDGLGNHQALAQIWALLILEVADRPLLPFDLRTYANSLRRYVDVLEQDADGALDSQPLRAAIDKMSESADQFHHFEDVWTANVLGRGGLETTQYTIRRLEYNDRLAQFESDLTIPNGLTGRTQFKHVVFGPLAKGGKGEFPGVRDAMHAGNWTGAQAELGMVAERIMMASEALAR